LVPSNATALFDLQQAAGNRAVAQMLIGPRTAHSSPATRPISPISVQRHDFDDALSAQMDASKLDYKALAKGLIERVNSPSDGSDKDTSKTDGEEGATDAKVKGKADTALLEPTKIPDEVELKKRAADLKERQEKLDYKPTAEEQGRLDEKARLDALEQEMKDDAALKAREKKLNTPAKTMTSAEKKKTEELDALEQSQKETKALEDREKKLKQKLSPEQQKKKDELDDLDDEKKDAEALKEWNRKRSKVKLPAGKSMNDLLKGF
jgi:hypothetical protein